MDLIVRSHRVVLPGGTRPASIAVSGGTIAAVGPVDATYAGAREMDVGDAVVLPGLVDPHVHVNDPGRTEWEGFETAGRAAAAGGTTTIVDMPLNSIPATTTVAALDAKVAAASDRCPVDFGLWGGIVPGNEGELADLLGRGALGFKAFLVPSGVEEFPSVGDAELEAAMVRVAPSGAPVLVHAEDAGTLARASHALAAEPVSAAAWLASRPGSGEARAIARVAALSGRTGARVHIVHVAGAVALEEVARARRSGARLTAETCPHYLAFEVGEIPSGDTRFKCAPPIREASDRDALWRALGDGTLDLVASDHSPCPPELKPAGDFDAAWGGIAGLELRLPATWTVGRTRGATLDDLACWLAAAPAALAGLGERKGRIAPGLDADLVVWEPDEEWVVEGRALHQRHGATPWEGRTLSGAVRRTILRGRVVFDDGAFPDPAAGRWLTPARSARGIAPAGAP